MEEESLSNRNISIILCKKSILSSCLLQKIIRAAMTADVNAEAIDHLRVESIFCKGLDKCMVIFSN